MAYEKGNNILLTKYFKVLIVSLTIVLLFFGFYIFTLNVLNVTIKVNTLLVIIFIVAFFVYIIDSILILFRFITASLQKDTQVATMKNLYRFWIATNASALLFLNNTARYGLASLVMILLLYIISIILYKKHKELL